MSIDLDKLLELQRSRRSVRQFTSDPIPPGIEEKLLTAMIWAPSAGNAQPWHFVRVSRPETKRLLSLAAHSQGSVAEAPLVVVACVDLNRAQEAYGDRGASLYCIQDVAAAVQNLMLAAHATGLGSCWVGAFGEQEVAAALELPKHLRPVAMVPLGVPSENPTAPPRRPLLEVTGERK